MWLCRVFPLFGRPLVAHSSTMVMEARLITYQDKRYGRSSKLPESHISQGIPITNPRFRDPSLSFLSTAKDQKALNIGPAKPTLAQQFPATVNRELGHDHDADILGADASFI